MNFASVVLLRIALYEVLNSVTLNVIFLVPKLMVVQNSPTKWSSPSVLRMVLGWSRGRVIGGFELSSRNSHRVKGVGEERLIELPPSIMMRKILIFLIMGSTTIGYHLGAVVKVGWSSLENLIFWYNQGNLMFDPVLHPFVFSLGRVRGGPAKDVSYVVIRV